MDRWEVWTVGREGRGGPDEGRLKRREGFLAGLRTGKVLLQEAAQKLNVAKASPSMLSSWDVLHRLVLFCGCFFLSPWHPFHRHGAA